MVTVEYAHREGNNPELVNFVETGITARRVHDIIIDYPWQSALAWFEQEGDGGGFHFISGDLSGIHAYYQFTPSGLSEGFLTLDIVLKKGIMGMFGRQSKSIDFGTVTVHEAIPRIQELCSCTIPALYEKYNHF